MNEQELAIPTGIVDTPENATEALRLDERLLVLERDKGVTSKTVYEIEEIRNRILMSRIRAGGYVIFMVFMLLAYRKFLRKVEKEGK